VPVFVYVLRIYPYQSINRCHLTKSIRKAFKLHVEFRIGIKEKYDWKCLRGASGVRMREFWCSKGWLFITLVMR
jgi:hypothetical protein